MRVMTVVEILYSSVAGRSRLLGMAQGRDNAGNMEISTTRSNLRMKFQKGRHNLLLDIICDDSPPKNKKTGFVRRFCFLKIFIFVRLFNIICITLVCENV